MIDPKKLFNWMSFWGKPKEQEQQERLNKLRQKAVRGELTPDELEALEGWEQEIRDKGWKPERTPEGKPVEKPIQPLPTPEEFENPFAAQLEELDRWEKEQQQQKQKAISDLEKTGGGLDPLSPLPAPSSTETPHPQVNDPFPFETQDTAARRKEKTSRASLENPAYDYARKALEYQKRFVPVLPLQEDDYFHTFAQEIEPPQIPPPLPKKVSDKPLPNWNPLKRNLGGLGGGEGSLADIQYPAPGVEGPKGPFDKQEKFNFPNPLHVWIDGPLPLPMTGDGGGGGGGGAGSGNPGGIYGPHPPPNFWSKWKELGNFALNVPVDKHDLWREEKEEFRKNLSGIGKSAGKFLEAPTTSHVSLEGDNFAKQFSGMFGVVSNAGAAIGGPWGKAIEWGGKLGEALFGAAGKLSEWTAKLHESNMRFAEFSTAMATVQGEQHIRDVDYSRRRGEALASSARALAEASSARRETEAPFENGLQIIRNRVGTGFEIVRDWALRTGLNVVTLGQAPELTAQQQRDGGDNTLWSERAAASNWPAIYNRPDRFGRFGYDR